MNDHGITFGKKVLFQTSMSKCSQMMKRSSSVSIVCPGQSDILQITCVYFLRDFSAAGISSYLNIFTCNCPDSVHMTIASFLSLNIFF